MDIIKICAVGDISLQTRNDRPSFCNISKIFNNSDIIFGNLETVLSSHGVPAEKAVVLHAPPKKIEWLKEAGFNVVNIANNHIFDLGEEGFNSTLDVLHQNEIEFIGGKNRKYTTANAIIETKNINIGFLGYSGARTWSQNGATINGIVEDEIIRDIVNLKVECDCIIVSLHWGVENVFYPSPKQIELAHKIIDSGATIILGHHPHVIQGIEEYNDGLIAYSLGNFQFNPALSQSPTNQSFMLGLTLDNTGVIDYCILPIVIDDEFMPNIPNEKEQEEIRQFVIHISNIITNEKITWGWWFEQLGQEYLSGNLKSWLRRIKSYGPKHLSQCVVWLISPFTICCYYGIIRKCIRNITSG